MTGNAAIDRYLTQISNLLKNEPSGDLLDLGCGNGEYTSLYMKASGAKEVTGVDIHESSLELARRRGIRTVQHDLDEALPFEDNSFSVIITTQVIEHLFDCDHFASEIFRVLRPGGYAIFATENLACWSNVLSLVLGYQPHTESISKVRRIGNPFAGNYGEVMDHEEMQHIHVFTYRSLYEFLNLHGFKVEASRCSGYPPFPHGLSGIMARLDPYHARYMSFKVRKPLVSDSSN